MLLSSSTKAKTFAIALAGAALVSPMGFGAAAQTVANAASGECNPNLDSYAFAKCIIDQSRRRQTEAEQRSVVARAASECISYLVRITDPQAGYGFTREQVKQTAGGAITPENACLTADAYRQLIARGKRASAATPEVR